ncbi:MAG: hypothetical protein CMG71_01080 [Candidatus Marinimicrobia bacterium]|nr:hypothetical protein [Candidatus Neomarinimicrobiota bacterium]
MYFSGVKKISSNILTLVQSRLRIRNLRRNYIKNLKTIPRDTLYILSLNNTVQNVGPDIYLINRCFNGIQKIIVDLSAGKYDLLGKNNYLRLPIKLKLIRFLDMVIFKAKYNYAVNSGKIYARFGQKSYNDSKVKEITINGNKEKIVDRVINKNRTYFPAHCNDMILADYNYYKVHNILLEDVVRVYKMVFSFSKDFFVKNHALPFGSMDDRSRVLNKITSNEVKFFPNYIPSELLFPNVKSSVIGISSLSLIRASRQAHLTAVSLIHLLNWQSMRKKKIYLDFLKTNNVGEIIYPHTLEELKNVFS